MAAPRRSPASAWAARAVRLASLWVLAGAAFKLLAGTPADLPPVVREVPAGAGLELGTTYRLAIAVELAIAFTALLRPRLGWIPLALLFAAFELVLVTMIGDESCGCFGSGIEVAPTTMMAVDGALLVLLLATRPWRTLARGGPNVVLIAGALALAVALPWLLDRQVESVGTVEADGRPVEGAWLELDIESWVGLDVWDTPIGPHLDLDSVFLDGLWVLYRQTCDHCAEHLAELARTEVGERLITLVRLKEPHDTEANRVVFELPEGGFVQHVELPDSITYVLQTPGELVLEAGRIVSAREGVSSP